MWRPYNPITLPETLSCVSIAARSTAIEVSSGDDDDDDGEAADAEDEGQEEEEEAEANSPEDIKKMWNPMCMLLFRCVCGGGGEGGRSATFWTMIAGAVGCRSGGLSSESVFGASRTDCAG